MAGRILAGRRNEVADLNRFPRVADIDDPQARGVPRDIFDGVDDDGLVSRVEAVERDRIVDGLIFLSSDVQAVGSVERRDLGDLARVCDPVEALSSPALAMRSRIGGEEVFIAADEEAALIVEGK